MKKKIIAIVILVVALVVILVPKPFISSTANVKVTSVLDNNAVNIKYNEDELIKELKDCKVMMSFKKVDPIDMNKALYEISIQIDNNSYGIILGEENFVYKSGDVFAKKIVTNLDNIMNCIGK